MALPDFVKPLARRDYVLNREQWKQMLSVVKRREEEEEGA